MLRPGLTLAALLIGLVWHGTPARAAGDDVSSSLPLRFVQGLRERGYYDLALEYLDQLRQAPDTPPALKVVIDYEVGRGLLEQASHTADLQRRREQLDQARTKLDAFTKANPNHPLAPEALVQLARLLVERGHLAMLQSEEEKLPADKQAKLAEARTALTQASAAYDKAQVPLKKAYESFDRFIPEGDPRKDARERAHVALMDAELQRALVDYEEAQTYPMGSKERNDLLDKGIAAFGTVYKDHRTQLAGLYAHMWQGKCYEEKGDLGPAMGVYNELMEHTDPHLRPLQREVGYFRIIVIGKRKEYALAADEAVRWLQSNPTFRHSREGIGVMFELAKDIIAQLDNAKGAERDAAVKRATDVLSELVRYYSPHKLEALALLQKYKPRAAAAAALPANMSYDDAMAQADASISSQEWSQALRYLKAAVRKADPAKDSEKANRARYLMAFCYYQNKEYYEADVLAEFLARRYSKWGLSPKATEIGMASLTFAYNTFLARDRLADLQRLIDLAKYTAETFPETDQGDTARLTLGDIYQGQGKYAAAAQMYEAVRKSSARHADAENKGGTAHWKNSLVLRESEKGSEADAELKSAEALLKDALKARQDAGAAAQDPGLIGNACDLAEIYLATERSKDALALLDPIVAGLGTATPAQAVVASASRLLATEMRAHIATGQVAQALADMRRLETLGGKGTNLTQLYFELGRLLKKEMDALQAKGDQPGYDRMQQAYLKFLQALVTSQSGQSYDSLQWAGEAMLSLSQAATEQAVQLKGRRMVREAASQADTARSLANEALAVFQRVLDTYSKDEAFQKLPSAGARLLRTKLRMVSAYRGQQQFAQAQELVDQLISQNRGLLDPLLEKGLLLEDMAEAGKGNWSSAYEHWNRLAARLGQTNPKPRDYYEATYHVALVLSKEGKKSEAARLLRGRMRLSPRVGGPEMKAKYEKFLLQLEGAANRA